VIDGEDMRYKVVLWGLGKIYNKMLNTLRYYELKKEIEIVALTAETIPSIHFLDGYPVKTKEELGDLEFDIVLILNDVHEKDIFKKAVEIGIPEEELVFYRVLELPMFHFDSYMELKKSRMSIISNNCWGGSIYHTLGMECLSPFKNLFLDDEDYLRLLKNLRYYLSCELRFNKYGIDIHSKAEYPVMCLDDVLVHCNHAKTDEDASADWKRRVRKMNWDNIFIEMYTQDKNVAREFSRLDEYRQKVCFVPFEEEHESWMHLKAMGNSCEFYEIVNCNAGNGNGSLAYFPLELLQGIKRHRYE